MPLPSIQITISAQHGQMQDLFLFHNVRIQGCDFKKAPRLVAHNSELNKIKDGFTSGERAACVPLEQHYTCSACQSS